MDNYYDDLEAIEYKFTKFEGGRGDEENQIILKMQNIYPEQ